MSAFIIIFVLMKKSLLLSAFSLCLSAAFAQYDLTITYNSNSGVSNLQTATKLYMHSGGNDMAGPIDGKFSGNNLDDYY